MQHPISKQNLTSELGPNSFSAILTRLGRNLKRNAILYLMAAPGLLFFLVFAYLPMFGIIIAFKSYRAADGILDSKWAGLDNFKFLFGVNAGRVVVNTLASNSLFIFTGTIAALTLALLINEIRDHNKILTNIYQSALFMPHFISYVIVSYFVFTFLNTDNGILNHMLQNFGVDGVSWYRKPEYWPTILTSVNLWKNAGFSSIIYLSGMLAINPEYYEAARIDGANKWQQIRLITLPLIVPLITITTLLSVGSIFRADFGLFFQVTRDSVQLYPTTDVMDTFVYRALRQQGDISMAAAAGFFQSLVGFVLVMLTNWAVKRTDPDRALF